MQSLCHKVNIQMAEDTHCADRVRCAEEFFVVLFQGTLCRIHESSGEAWCFQSQDPVHALCRYTYINKQPMVQPKEALDPPKSQKGTNRVPVNTTAWLTPPLNTPSDPSRSEDGHSVAPCQAGRPHLSATCGVIRMGGDGSKTERMTPSGETKYQGTTVGPCFTVPARGFPLTR